MGGCTTKTIDVEKKDIDGKNHIYVYSNFREEYQFISYLSRGRFGCIRVYCRKGQPKVLYAIKTIYKEFFNYEVLSRGMHIEIPALCKLDHPNIGKFYEAYEESGYYHVVMEYVKGSNLYKAISERKFHSLRDICEISYNTLRALAYMHSQGLVHMDVKPENIIFGKPGVFSTLKVIDYGLSSSYFLSKVSFEFQSSQFMAPELLKGEYNPKSDLWSVGIILYILVTGVYPYKGCEDPEFSLKHGEYNSEPLLSKSISLELRDLIFKLLKSNPKFRISSTEVLDHPFFNMLDFQDCQIDESVFQSLQEFSMKSQIEKEILYHIAFCNSDSELEKLKESFEQLDPDNTGVINFDDFKYMFEKILKKSSKDIEQAWQGLDFHKLGKINYSQFIAATVKNLEFLKEEKIQTLFNIFDIDNSGFITKDNFLDIIKMHEKTNEMDKEKVSDILIFFKEHKHIAYDQFKRLIGYH